MTDSAGGRRAISVLLEGASFICPELRVWTNLVIPSHELGRSSRRHAKLSLMRLLVRGSNRCQVSQPVGRAY